ncbi:MAG: hypothetical protein V8S39_11415 [Lachnospiraceae bacterium]|jgi:predicted DNA-binding transcriptional regulator YafY
MEDIKNKRIERIFAIYIKLKAGGIIKKPEEALKYKVDERTIQRDIDELRNCLSNLALEDGSAGVSGIYYSRKLKGFLMKQEIDEKEN